MGRSIHWTRRDLADLEHARNGASEQRARGIAELRAVLKKKRRIKRQVRGLRRADGRPAWRPLDAIRIEAFGASQHNHYPADADSIYDFLRRLPNGIVDGLQGIELRAGAEDQRAYAVKDSHNLTRPDPWTGRQSVELMEGVFGPPVMGSYRTPSRKIYLFAYVYELGIAQREIIEFYLRLKMLSTLVHEVAHHFDFTYRVARDRWRADDYDKCEHYAEGVQYDWMTKYVIPYLESAYAEQTVHMRQWLRTHVGIETPLRLLAGEPRSAVFLTYYETSRAFELVFNAVAQDQPSDQIRIRFAADLFYAGERDLPERILRAMLRENPKNVDALALAARIAEDRQDSRRAIELAERALSLDRSNDVALRTLTLTYGRTRDWQRLFRAAQRMVDERSGNTWDVIWGLESCALARFYQGRRDDFEMFVAQIEAFNYPLAKRKLEGLHALAARRA